MIATIEGNISEKLLDTVVVVVGGVGYGVLMTAEDYGALMIGSKQKLYIYEHIRESAHDLYGFCTLDTKLLFEQLLSVNGVGPKMALSILSVGTNSEVRIAIANGDTKLIQTANGVGKRVAERVVIDLKDKVGIVGDDGNISDILTAGGNMPKDEAFEALLSLGYSAQDASAALSKVDDNLSTEDRVKQALKGNG